MKIRLVALLGAFLCACVAPSASAQIVGCGVTVPAVIEKVPGEVSPDLAKFHGVWPETKYSNGRCLSIIVAAVYPDNSTRVHYTLGVGPAGEQPSTFPSKGIYNPVMKSLTFWNIFGHAITVTVAENILDVHYNPGKGSSGLSAKTIRPQSQATR